MKNKNISYMSPIFREALPYYKKGGSTAVLIIHGYLGSPYEVTYLAEKLYSEGYTVSVPRLPGHATDSNDFLETGKRDWLRRVFDSYMELKSICSSVIIAGFSMGGLLAVHAAYRFETEKLILIAPALTNRRKLMLHMTPLLKYFKKTLKKDCRINTETEYEEYLKKEYWSNDWISAASDILFMQIRAKKLLKKLKSEVLLIISENDRAVPVTVSEIIRKRIRSEHLTEKRLLKSDHMIFHSNERDDAAGYIIEWLNS